MRQLRVIGPCDNDWNAMEPRGGGGGRHCGACDRTVVDLSVLTRREVEALLAARAGRMCARVARDAEGYAVFREEPAGATTSHVSALAGSAALAAALVAAGCGTSSAATPSVPLVSQEQLQAPADPAAPTMVPTPPGAAPPVAPAAPPAPVVASAASASSSASASAGATASATASATTVTIPVRTGTKVRHHSARVPPSISSYTMGDLAY